MVYKVGNMAYAVYGQTLNNGRFLGIFGREEQPFYTAFLASIAILIIPPVKTSEPPSETSPIKAQSDKSSVIILFTARMAAIIVKSYSEPHLLHPPEQDLP